jgi:hypothetical protein
MLEGGGQERDERRHSGFGGKIGFGIRLPASAEPGIDQVVIGLADRGHDFFGPAGFLSR